MLVDEYPFMRTFSIPLSLRWSDFDPNVHLRHSVYYDFGAQLRIRAFVEVGLTLEVMKSLQIGPILFREECVFRREIRFGEAYTIDLQLLRLRRDYGRWSFRHRIVRADQTHCATIQVDGAWMDTAKRKLTLPPPLVIEALDQIERAEDFEWIE